MAESSKIEWTDHTFNPWWGCEKVHLGCDNCYAEAFDRRMDGGHWGPDSPRRMIVGEWGKPDRWNVRAFTTKRGGRARVFCASMCDIGEAFSGPVLDQLDRPVPIPSSLAIEMGLPEYRERFGGMDFHEPGTHWTVPLLRSRVWKLITFTDNLDWLLLTKRPGPLMRAMPTHWVTHRAPPNLWTGVSVSNQETADRYIGATLRLPGRHFLSVEPMVGPIRFNPEIFNRSRPSFVEWVIVGGESGPKARPLDIEWVRRVRDQVRGAGARFFFKQAGRVVLVRNDRMSEWPDEAAGLEVLSRPEDAPFQGSLLRVRLADLKGGNPAEWPPDLNVREFPDFTNA